MMDFFSIKHIMVTIPIGEGGYALSWLEAVVTLTGLLCIWLASKEKIINYLFGLITVTLASAIFFQIQLYASLLLQIFFFVANVYGWYAWSRQNESHEVALKIRWLPRRKAIHLTLVCVVAIALLTLFIDPVFAMLTRVAVEMMQGMGMAVTLPQLQPDAFPLWDSTILVLSIAAMVLMTRKYVENWLLWVAIDIISIVLFAVQGVYVLALENILLTVIAGMGALTWMKTAKLNHSQPLH